MLDRESRRGAALSADEIASPVFGALFAAEHFRRQLAACGVDASGADEADLVALLRGGDAPLRASPSPFFDPSYYAAARPASADGTGPNFADFLRFGLGAGIAPHPVVDVAFIARDQGVDRGDAVATWLSRQSLPNADLWHVYARLGAAPPTVVQRDILASLAAHGLDAAQSARALPYLPLVVAPELAGGGDAWSLAAHAVGPGAGQPLPSAFVRGSFAEALLPSLRRPVSRRWSFSPRLHMGHYAFLRPDLETIGVEELALHFLLHGQYEGYAGHPAFDAAWYRAQHALRSGETIPLHYALAARRGEIVRPRAVTCSPAEMAARTALTVDEAIDEIAGHYDRLFDIAAPDHRSDRGPDAPDDGNDRAVERQIRAAAALDRTIKPSWPGRLLLPKPFDIGHALALERLLPAIEGCDTLLLRDHITIGGADRVAGRLAAALAGLGRRVAVVAVDRTADFAIGRSFYADCPLVVLRDELDAPDPEREVELCYELMSCASVERVFNVNCAPAWTAMERFGRQLGERVSLNAYYFCDDRDGFGNVDGYPARTFLPTIEHLDAVLTDSSHLRNELAARVSDVPTLTNRLHVLPTPYVPREHGTAAARPPSVRPDADHAVAWAGRFDRQKRVDLLPRLAASMPDVAFHVWGKPVLDLDPFQGGVPDGLDLHGTFADFGEVLTARPDAFLYTAAWDGVPTIVLDAVAAGLPIVASDVGGVRECLPPDYPFLVPPGRGAEDYETALRALFAALRAEGRAAVTAGYADVLARRDGAAFSRRLAAIMDRAGSPGHVG